MADATRAEAIATLEEGQANLDALFARLSDEAMSRPRTIGGGDWSAKDLLGHVAFWEELAIEIVDAHGEGRPARLPDLGATGGVDRANLEDQRRTAAQALEEVRQRAAAAHRGLIHRIRALSDDAWNAEIEGGRGPRPLGDVVGGVTGMRDRPFGHAWAHLDDLEAYVSSVGQGG